MRMHLIGMGILVALAAGCRQGDGKERSAGSPDASLTDTVMDSHSAARPQEAYITHLDLDIEVDMQARRIAGTARYSLNKGHGERVVFDTDGLTIEAVTLPDGSPLEHSLGEVGAFGTPLQVVLPRDADSVLIRYATGPSPRALQFLSPRQTQGGRHPFLFTQGQAILTRSWIPIQDSPGIRFTYTAQVRVPSELMAVMSASNPQQRSTDGRYQFRMDQPIPAYLMALAVGDIAYRSVGPRTGVYAEPALLEKAAWEFADMETMVTAAEELYGPYRWERYDVLVLPPSFPFGGMENPRLTFATPTILAGDRSLTALIAHELAHSWSGNLVTNATWNDFWLNEGFTVYFEKRICEKVYGPEYAAMLDLLGYQDMLHTVAKLKAEGKEADTSLRIDLSGRDPDDGVTDIAYEKGYAFLRRIEEEVGRDRFDAFLRDYFDRFAFQSMTTDGFLDHLRSTLLDPLGVKLDVAAWVDGTGVPADVVVPKSDRFVKVEMQIERWKQGTPARDLETAGWTTFEWMHFVRHLPEPIDPARMTELDDAFSFTTSGNSEILAAWLQLCVRQDHAPSYEALDHFLTHVGRRKFVLPLYEELVKTEKGKSMAMNIYQAARRNYHSVTVRSVDDVLEWKKLTGEVSL